MRKTNLLAAGALTLAAVFAMSDIATAQGRGRQKPRQVPETGVEKVPTPADAAGEALLEQMTSRSSEGLVEVVHADGTVSVDLQGRFMNVMVATPTADGGHTIACATGHEALKHATAGATGKTAVQKARRAAAPTTPARELK